MGSYSARLHKAIPGGAHTYSRGDDQFPSNAPEILEKGSGAYVWDADGKQYLDYGMGLRSVNIGYGNKEIADAAYAEILKGNNLTRASITELIAAETLIETIPSIEMVKFAKHGSTVTTAAVKLARAYTGRPYICVPRQQPFFSFDDWFIGSTVMNKGVLAGISDFTLLFDYNDPASLQQLFEQYPGQIAGVMLEGATTMSPFPDAEDPFAGYSDRVDQSKNFLHKVKTLCRQHDALFILDEMITGFRWHLKGAQFFYDIEPDLTTFGKAMANGFAVAVLGGKRHIMDVGGILESGKERVFLTSTTHGAEMGALSAFLKTLEIMKRDNVVDHFWKYGKALKDEANSIAKELGIHDQFYFEGFPCSLNYITKDKDGKVSLAHRTLFSQEMISQGILMPYVALSLAHKDAELNKTLDAMRSALTVYKKALESSTGEYLKGHTIKPVFRKNN